MPEKIFDSNRWLILKMNTSQCVEQYRLVILEIKMVLNSFSYSFCARIRNFHSLQLISVFHYSKILLLILSSFAMIIVAI